MGKLAKMALAASALLISGQASADGFVCTVKPAIYLGVGGNGWVSTWIDGLGVVTACSMSETQGGVTAPACTAWYGSLLSGKLTAHTGTFYFDSANPTIGGKTSCSQFSPWEVHVPYFMQLD